MENKTKKNKCVFEGKQSPDEKYEWSVTGDNEDSESFFLSRDGTQCMLTVVKLLTGGKSGDLVVLVKHSNKHYVMKIFDSKSDRISVIDREISCQLEFRNMWKKDETKWSPIPIIYTNGYIDKLPVAIQTKYNKKFIKKFRAKIVNELYRFVIMEFIDGISMSDFIIARCTDSKKYKDIKDRVDNVIGSETNGPDRKSILKSLMQQLFMILYWLKLSNQNQFLNHCDLHTDNVLITKKQVYIPHPNLKDDFVKRNFEYKFKYSLKLIDFGLATGDKCSKRRVISGVMSEVMSKCKLGNVFKRYYQLTKGELVGYNGDPDINFFITLMKILQQSGLVTYTSNKKLNELYRESVSGKKDPKYLLGSLWDIIIQSRE